MIVSQNDKAKQRYVKKYWREMRRTFVACRQSVLDKAEYVDPANLKTYVDDLLRIHPMREKYLELWGEVGGKFGYATERQLTGVKSGIEYFDLKADPKKAKDWTEKMRKYAAERSLQKINAIMTTEEEAINAVIDKVIKRTLDEGLGIVESRKIMVDALNTELVELEKWQAQRIAMTEVGSAANTSSYLSAQEYGEGYKKQWKFQPGKKTFRENHMGFEDMGPVDRDYEYLPGLAYPGDPRGAAEEVINCYCSFQLIKE